MDNEKFGNFIKELRKEKGLTQKELGDKLNITDKAISKWERGLSFPDISMLNLLADFFEIDVAELLNGEKGIKQEINVEELIQEAIEKYKNLEEKRNKKIRKIKNIIGIFSLIIFVISILIQGAYFIILKRHNYEYVIDSLTYIINQVIILSATVSLSLILKKNKIIKLVTFILCFFLTIINIAFLCNNGFNNKCIVSFSSNFSNELVLKINKNSNSIKLYRNVKLFIFAKEKEQFSHELDGEIKKQWLTNDICALTYTDKEGTLREFVATYGDRGNGISYYNIAPSLEGGWQVFRQYGSPTQLYSDSKGITIIKNGEKEIFEHKDYTQFGTIALVLYKDTIPKYVIALDENCKLDEKTGIIKKGGTITLSQISMEKTIAESLYCMTYKNENDLSNYNYDASYNVNTNKEESINIENSKKEENNANNDLKTLEGTFKVNTQNDSNNNDKMNIVFETIITSGKYINTIIEKYGIDIKNKVEILPLQQNKFIMNIRCDEQDIEEYKEKSKYAFEIFKNYVESYYNIELNLEDEFTELIQ